MAVPNALLVLDGMLDVASPAPISVRTVHRTDQVNATQVNVALVGSWKMSQV